MPIFTITYIEEDPADCLAHQSDQAPSRQRVSQRFSVAVIWHNREQNNVPVCFEM